MTDDFRNHWQQLNWYDLSLRINSKTACDVEQALSAEKLTREDFMALLSPGATFSYRRRLSGAVSSARTAVDATALW
jgi:hypothetical protein